MPTSNLYNDTFLSALGAWQRGWREDSTRRLAITATLTAAIAPLRDDLPISRPPPLSYRKRFLVPNNTQNNGDFAPPLWGGRIDEGVAAWTSDPTMHWQFKEMIRPGNVTALFTHQPSAQEVLVDLNALWANAEFIQAVKSYADRGGENADALLNFKDHQRELILDTPLLCEEVIGFVGVVGDDSVLFEALGANSDEQQDGRHGYHRCWPAAGR